MANPSFNISVYKKTKNTIINEIKTGKKEIDSFKRLVISSFIKNNSIVNNTVGNIKDFKNINYTDVKKFYKKYYIGENIVVSIVGDFYIKDLKNKIISILGYFKKGLYKDYSDIKFKKGSNSPISYKLNNKYSYIDIYTKSFDASNNKNMLMNIALECLKSKMSSLFKQKYPNVLVKLSSSNYSFVNGGYLNMSIKVPINDATSIFDLVNKELSSFGEKGFTDKEIQDSKLKLESRYKLLLIDSFMQANVMSSDELVGRGFNYYQEYDELIASATTKAVNDLCKTNLFASGTYVIGVTKP